MVDRYVFLDQPIEDSDIILQKVLELNSVIPLFMEFNKIFNSSFLLQAPWEEGFFLYFVGEYSKIDPRKLNFWKRSNIFEPIHPIWNISLTTQAFKFIMCESNKEDYMFYFLDLMRGRFVVKEKLEYCLIIAPLYSVNENLLAMIIKEKFPNSETRILVRKMAEINLKQLVNITVQEIYGSFDKLEKLNDFGSETFLLQFGTNYLPSHLFGVGKEEKGVSGPSSGLTSRRNKSLQKQGKQNLQVKNVKVPEQEIKREFIEPKEMETNKIKVIEKNLQKKNFKVPEPEKKREFIEPKKIEEVKIKGIEKNQIPEVLVNEVIKDIYFKNEKQISHYIKQNRAITAETTDLNSSPNLLKLKTSIELNRKSYLSLLKRTDNESVNWVGLLANYLVIGQCNKLPFDIFSDFIMDWKIFIEEDLLNILLDIKEEEFLSYFEKILRVSQGFAFDNFEEFQSINKNPAEDFFIIPLIPHYPNLRPIFSVLCLNHNKSAEYEYQFKLIGFYSDRNPLEKQVEDFRKRNNYLNVETAFGRNGMGSLTLIEKMKKIIPVFPLNTVQKNIKKRTIFILYSLPKNSKCLKFLLVKEQFNSFTGTRCIINNTENKMNAHVIVFKTDFPAGANYKLTIKKKSEQKWGFESGEWSNRKIEEQEYQFIFDTKFNREGNFNFDYFCKLYIYLLYISQINFFEGLEFIIKAFCSLKIKKEYLKTISLERQAKIIEHVEEFYLNKPSLLDLEDLYSPLSIIGLLESFPSTQVTMSLKNLNLLVLSIEKNSSFYLQKFKTKMNFGAAVKGLAKIFAAAKIQRLNIRPLFESIIDHSIQNEVLMDFLQIINECNIEITGVELELISSISSNFSNEYYSFACEKVLESIKGLTQKIEFIFNPSLTSKLNEEKKSLFLNILRDFTMDYVELRSFLKYMKDQNFFKNYPFAKREISSLIKKDLSQKTKKNIEDLRILKLMLENFKNDEFIADCDIRNFHRIQLKFYDFHSYISLTSLNQDCTIELFQDWIEVKNLSPGTKIWTQEIDNEISFLQIDQQQSLSMYALNKFSEGDLKNQLENIFQAKSYILKKCYKKVFMQKLLTVSDMNKYKGALAFLENKRKAQTNNLNNILFELLFQAYSIYINSENELSNMIIINPKESDILLDLIKNFRFDFDSNFSIIFKFFSKFIKQILSKEMQVELFELIIHQTQEKRKAFFAYIMHAYDNVPKYEYFKNSFFLIESEFKKSKNKLKCAQIVFSVFPSKFEALSLISQEFFKFSESHKSLKLKEFEIPSIFSSVANMTNIPFKSKIFNNLVTRAKSKFNYEFQESVIVANNILATFFNQLRSKDYMFNIEELYNLVECINSPDLFSIEIKAFNKCSQLIFKIDLKEQEKLIKIFTVFIGYKDFKLLTGYLCTSRKALKLSKDLLKDLIFPETQLFDEKFSATVLEFTQKKLMKLARTEKDCLINFFEQVSKSTQLVSLAYSLEEDDLNFWREIFDNRIEHKELTLDLIQNFSFIWSFFDMIKNFKDDLRSYFVKIVELIKIRRYSSITKFISECNLKINVLVEFNKTLNNQEQVKLNKIKMICNDSCLRIIKKKIYTVELTAARPNEGYNSTPVSLSDLAELRDRALLIKYTINQQVDEIDAEKSSDLQIFDQFTIFVSELTEFLNVLTELGNSLFRNDLIEEYVFYLKNGKFEELSINLKKQKNKLNEGWKKILKRVKKNSYWINFLNEEMIYLVDNYLFDPNKENFNRILKVLKFMSKAPPSSIIRRESSNKNIYDRLIEVNQFLNSLVDIKKINFQIKIKEQVSFSIVIAETDEFYKGVLSIYSKYQIALPSVDLVFFCHVSTEWEEIERFLNRCKLNPNKEIYTIVNPEKLSLENQVMIESKLSHFIKKRDCCLAIVTNEINSKLLNSILLNPMYDIEKISKFMMLTDKQISNTIESLSQNIKVITSAYVGLGKTETIKQAAKMKNVSLYELDILTTYDNHSLSKKVESALRHNEALYKINLNSLSDPEYFQELIFSLALFKMAYKEHSIIVVPENSFIYIEIANTFNNNLYKSVPFLKFLKVEHIDNFKLKKVFITREIAYVCNYLSLLENGQINKVDLQYEKETNKLLPAGKKGYLRLLNQYFLPNCGKHPNFHQLVVFIKVLTKLLAHFEKSMFSAEVINIYNRDFSFHNLNVFSDLRACILLNLIETSKEFMSKCVDAVKNSQNLISKVPEEEKKGNGGPPYIDSNIKWENSNHFIMLFLEDGDFMNIYRSHQMIPSFIKKFIINQNLIEGVIKNRAGYKLVQELQNNENNSEFLEDYNKYSSPELIERLLNFYKKFSLRRVAGSNEENEKIEVIIKKRLNESIKTGYVLTPDNFLKMNLIYMRCMSNLPLIIMGETGCGKTSLLRFFVENILREIILVIYIHSGITMEHIREHLEIANKEALRRKNHRVWVFFDEFNTSDCMNQIVSVLCERRFEEINLCQNLVFVGACNPYRFKSKISSEDTVGIKKLSRVESKTQLVHMVNPIPDKAAEFVWDFGTLKKNEIKSYVNSMLERVKLKQISLFSNLICAAHVFFQGTEDCSSVSLRDVNRFILLFKWFKKSIEKRKNYKIANPSEELINCSEIVKKLDNLEVQPGILSFIHCYYLRIASNTEREHFLEFVLKNYTGQQNLSVDQIRNLIKFQELDLVCRMNLPPKIALNQALMENIFAIVPCILNKIPVFVCGKPGCSKSLAINIISSSLRGDRSSDEYFKTLPELQLVCFQGSESCTSEGVEEIFNKAEKLLNKNRKILPVVIFDEIGLAEVSKHNPLKVLHRLLEYENCKVGFIAISNWRLDASKMNRALYLARADPDKKDLISTAQTIFKSYSELLDTRAYDSIICDTVEGYLKLKQEYEELETPDFFGLRDFYHAIKYIARKLKNNSKKNINQIAQLALLRNFDGQKTSINHLSKHFTKVFSDKVLHTTPIDLIEANLKDKNSRYLMIICDQDVSELLKIEKLSKILPNHRYVLGSTFEKDINQEDARFRILSDIIAYMEQGIPIILHNMEIIYSSLYDLFNQNFTIVGKSRRYCRVALGAEFNPRCLVHENFKAVVFLDNDKNTLVSTDAPFLNRFEKHYLSLSDECDLNSSEVLVTVLRYFYLIMEHPDFKRHMDLYSLIPVLNQEIPFLITHFFAQIKNTDQLIEKCEKLLFSNSSMDIMLLCQIICLVDEEKENIMNKWMKFHNISMGSYLKKLSDKNRSKSVKMISVTFDTSEFNLNKLSEICKLDLNFGKTIQQEKCLNIKCEEDFKKSYLHFLKNPEKLIYILELEYSSESQHLRFLVNLIESLEKNCEFKKKNMVKNVIFILRQKRSDMKRKPVSLFKDWKYKMFEDLTFSGVEIIEKFMHINISDLFKDFKIFSSDGFSKDIVEKSLDTLSFKTKLFDYQYINDFKNEVSEAILNTKPVMMIFKEKIIEELNEISKRSEENWIFKLFTSEKIVRSAVSVKHGMKILIYETAIFVLTKFILACEKKSGLSSLLFAKSSSVLLKVWIEIFKTLKISNIQVQLKPETNQLNFMFKFRIPFFYEEFRLLKNNYLELSSSGINQKKILSNLKYFHLKNSIWKENAYLLYENKEVEEYFIKDFIDLTLTEKLLEMRYQEYIYFFINSILEPIKNKFKILSLFRFQTTIASLNNLLIIYHKYTTPNILHWTIESVPSDLELNLRMQIIFERIIDELSPIAEDSVKIKDIKTYSQDMILLKNLFSDLHISSEPNNLDKLDFWVLLCEMNNKDLILNIASKIAGKSHDYFLTDQVTISIIKSVSEVITQNNVQTYRFYIFLFKKLIKSNFVTLRFVVDRINVAETWKYSSDLIENILIYAEIKDMLRQVEVNMIDFEGIMNNTNSYLQIIGELLKKSNWNTPFFVMLGDKLNALNLDIEPENYGKICKIYMDYIESSSNNPNCLNLLVAVSRVKFYLKEFTELIENSKTGIKAKEQDKLISIGKVLKKRQLLVFELYCLKLLKKYTDGNVYKLYDYCLKTNYKWKINFRDIAIKSTLYIFPIANDIAASQSYGVILIKIYNLRYNLHELDDIIYSSQKEAIVSFELGLAFLNSVYLMHSSKNFDSTVFCKWFNEKSNIIQKNFGREFSLLLELFIKNFPKDSLCFLYLDMDQNKLGIAMLICYLNLMCISYAKTPNFFSNQFFDLCGLPFPSISEKSRKSFYLGAETPKIQDYLNMMRVNFNFIKNTNFYSNFSKGGSYVCSSTCDYLYIIQNCGGAMVESVCPFCEEKIGGTNHVIVPRPGHRNLSDNEAIQYLQEKTIFYQTEEPKGFIRQSTNIPLSTQRRLNHQTTFTLLNLFTNSIFYFLHLTNIYSHEDLNSVYNLKTGENLKIIIETIIIQNYTDISQKIALGDEFLFWILETANKFRELFMKYNRPSELKTKRDKFEGLFENKIMSPSFFELISQYKISLSALTKPSMIIKYIDEIEKPREPVYMFIDLFRYTLKPSWGLMREAFEFCENKEGLKLLSYFIQEYENLQNLNYLWPIVNFCREMINECSFKISRAEATNIKIKELLSKNLDLPYLFKEFLKAWKGLKIDLKFGCKTFEKKNISDKTPIGYLLVDTDINSLGIQVAAALKTLFEIQNSICEMLPKNKNPGIKRHSLSNISKEDIFYLSQDELEYLVQKCSVNSFEYGKGGEIFYDFQLIYNHLKILLDKAKLFDSESLETVQYNFELLHTRSRYAGIIVEIRGKLRQNNLESDEIKKIEKEIRVKSINSKVDEIELWNQGYTWLCKLSLNIKHDQLNDSLLLKKYSEIRLDVEQDFGVCEIFYLFKLSQFIAIYEFTEIKIFPIVVRSIDEQYKIKVDDENGAKKEISDFANKVCSEFSKHTLLECDKVLKRIIIRVLTGNTDPEFPISHFFSLESYWNIEYLDAAERIGEFFPTCFHLAHAIEVEKILEEILITEEY